MAIYRVQGADAVRAALLAFPQELAQKALNKALMAAAMPMRDSAREFSPVDTGGMKSTIRAAYDKKPWIAGMDARVIVYVPWKSKDAARYWRYVEFGTSKQPPQPFMRPAFEVNKQSAIQIIYQSLSDAIVRIAATLKK